MEVEEHGELVEALGAGGVDPDLEVVAWDFGEGDCRVGCGYFLIQSGKSWLGKERLVLSASFLDRFTRGGDVRVDWWNWVL